jgi:hypothetical protein
MPSLLGIADSSIHSTPNKQSSTITTEIESSPIAIESTIRISRLTKLRHNLTKRPSLYLRSRRIPSAAPPIAASSPLPALHDLETDGPNDMSTTEETQPLTASAPPPVPFSRLREIANSVRNPTHAKCKLLTTFQACEAALSSASAYEHPSTESWNATIINTILQALVKETSTPTTQPQYKFAINSTIIEHAPASSGTGVGKRGMHSAAAAYWNAEKDGMWNFKYEAAELKGLDVVVGIIWISI